MLTHESNSVSLDAQMLVLLVVGRASEDYIGRHKRLDNFRLADYYLLLDYLRPVRKIVVTPNVLSEASNLIGQIGEPARAQIFQAFRELIGEMAEVYVPSTMAARAPAFVRLGLPDAVCLAADAESSTLLTTDLQLYLEAERIGRKVVNFNHLRDHD